jgi:hypothetical protein
MEAVAWSKEVAGYAEKKFGISKVETWLDAFGPIGTIRWSFDCPDLAAFEKVQTAMLTDQSYWQLIDKAFKNGLFIDGSGNDVICRQI